MMVRRRFQTTLRRNTTTGVLATIVALVSILVILTTATTAAAQQNEGRIIELETIEIESEVPRRVAQFFVQRDQLQYDEIDRQPTFIPDLLESVEDDPF